YFRAALRALRDAAASASQHGLKPEAIGITSQAQTFVTLDPAGKTIGPAVVWLDERAETEAKEADWALPDFPETCGFIRPSPLQFLPKVMHAQRAGQGGSRFLLLNEWILQRLTGEAFGDTTNQGMGGFWDISRNGWNERALGMVGITPESLATIGPAAVLCAPLTK